MRKRGKKNIQAANRREEERQAGCHTSKTGTQLQQTAEITGHEGKRNRRCERHMYPVIKTKRETGIHSYSGSVVQAQRVCLHMDCSSTRVCLNTEVSSIMVRTCESCEK